MTCSFILNDAEFSWSICAKFHGETPRKYVEFLRDISWRKKKVCANLRKISQSFLRRSSRLRIFVRGVNAKKELFSRADLYVASIYIH